MIPTNNAGGAPGDFIGQSIGFKQVVMRHLDRLSQISSEMSEAGGFKRFLLAVKTFEYMLRPYATEKYKRKRLEITEWQRKYELNNIKGKDPTDAEAAKNELYQEISERIFDALMELIADKGLGIEDDLICDMGGSEMDEPGSIGGERIASYIRSLLWRHNKSFLCAFLGGPGTGKSMSAASLACQIQPSWDIDQLCFLPSEFLKLLSNPEKTKKGSVIVWDEIGAEGMPARAWQSIMNQAVGSIMQVLRHRNIALLFTTPHIRFIDYQLRVLLSAKVETVSMNKQNKTCQCKFKMLFPTYGSMKSKEPYEKFPRIIMDGKRNRVPRINFHLPPSPIPEMYEKKAKEFKLIMEEKKLQKVRALEDTSNPSGRNNRREARKLFKKGGTTKDIAKKFNVSERAVRKWVEDMRN